MVIHNEFNQILHKMTTAISLENNKSYREAYHKYLEVVESSTHFLRQLELKHTHHQLQSSSVNEMVTQLCMYNGECLKRVQYLYTNHLSKSLPQSPDASHLVQDHLTHQHSDQVHSLNPLHSKHENPSAVHQQHHRNHHFVRKPKRNLAALRRMAEDMELQRLNHKMELEKRSYDLKQFERTLDLNSSRFKWKSQDVWSKFLDMYFDYKNMQADLLHEDSLWLQQLTELARLLPANSFNDSPSSPIDRKVLQEKIDRTIRDHFKVILKKNGHAIYSLLNTFLSTFCSEYATERFENMADEQFQIASVKDILVKAITDFKTFIDKLVQALFGKYWTDTMSDLCEKFHSCEKIVVQCIGEQLMVDMGLYFRFLKFYHIVNRNKNEILNEKINALHSSKLLPSDYGCSKKFNLREHFVTNCEPYKSAIDKFICFDEEKYVASDMLECLVDCIKEIDQCVIRYYENQPSEKRPKNLDLGADDLVPLLCYIVVCAKPSNLFSKANYIVDFSDEDIFTNEMGYAIASLETSLGYLINFDIYELKNSNDKPNLYQRDLGELQNKQTENQGSPTIENKEFLCYQKFGNGSITNNFECHDDLLDELDNMHLTEEDFGDLF
jgi:hypothetical protein